MGRFTTGVTIIGTNSTEGVHAMTANGFMSVSLDPALAMVSVATKAKMHELLLASGRYGVSFLGADQEAISRHFSGRSDLAPDFPFEQHAGAPLIRGALARISVEVIDAHRAGDHTLFIGRVQHMDEAPGDPLVFYSGGYRHLLHVAHNTEYSDAWSGFCLEPSGPLILAT
ncbi:flavin reductase family protein [Nocardia africana]